MYNRLIVHHIQFNWLSFLGNPSHHRTGANLYIKEFWFFEQPTLVGREKYAMRHDSYVLPAMRDNRTYKLLFDIIGDNEQERWDMMKKVQRAFAPDSNPSPTNTHVWKKLSFMDVQWKQWEVDVQVNQWWWPQLSNYNNTKRVGILANLISRTSLIFSKKLYTLEDRNHLLWTLLPTNVPLKMWYHKEIVHYEWVIDTPLSCRITALVNDATPLKTLTVYTRNLDKDSVLQIKWVDLQYWDIVEIDWNNQLIFLTKYHGTVRKDITGLVSLNSIRPLLTIGENIIAVDCEKWEEVLNVVWEWRDAF